MRLLPNSLKKETRKEAHTGKNGVLNRRLLARKCRLFFGIPPGIYKPLDGLPAKGMPIPEW
jgi:hypothetical protein